MTVQLREDIPSPKWQIQNQQLKELDELRGKLRLINHVKAVKRAEEERKQKELEAKRKAEEEREKKKKEALSYLPKLNSELMKIAKTGVIKKGNATRNVSKITRKINSL